MGTNASKKLKVKKNSLLPNKGFLTGLGSLFSLRGNYYSYQTSRTGLEADRKALNSDWQAVGNDILNSKNNFSY